VRYLSVCSGIEAASAAWHPLGWTPVAFSEVDKFPSAVLAHHYPTVPNWGDMTKFKEWPDADVDVLVGGTPCQSFSVAGLRKGMDDPRGNLALTYLAIAARYRPQWLVWENVPGVLSSNKGRDFGSILGGMVELGYGIAYRVLDAQHFGVPQRRRRIFVVGCLGDWRRAAAVLFEQSCLLGNPPPSRKARQTAPTIPSRRTAGGGLDTDFDCDGGLIPDVAPTMVANGNRTGGDRPYGTDGDTVTSLIPVIMSSGQANAEIFTDGSAPTITCLHDRPFVAMSVDLQNVALGGDVAGTLDTTRPGRGGGQAVLAFDLHGSPASEVASATDVHTPLRARMPGMIENSTTTVVATAFKASHFTRGKDGAPSDIVPPLSADADKGDQDTIVHAFYPTNRQPEFGNYEDVSPAIKIGSSGSSGNPPAIAFSSKDHGADAGEIAPTLRLMGHDGSHANGGGQVAVAFDTTQITSPGNYSNPQPGDPSHPLAAGAHPPAVAFMENVRGELRVSEQSDALTTGGGKPGQGYAAVLEPVTFKSRFARNGRGAPDTIVPPLKAQSGETGKGDAAPLVAFSIMPMNSGKDYKARETDVAQPIMAGGPVGGNQGGDFIKTAMQVRRLTPRECERLQGFPDDYTLIPWRGGMSPDGPRYKALGNSMAVPCMRFLGERIQMVSDLKVTP